MSAEVKSKGKKKERNIYLVVKEPCFHIESPQSKKKGTPIYLIKDPVLYIESSQPSNKNLKTCGQAVEAQKDPVHAHTQITLLRLRKWGSWMTI